MEESVWVYHIITSSDLLTSAVKLWREYRNHKIIDLYSIGQSYSYIQSAWPYNDYLQLSLSYDTIE